MYLKGANFILSSTIFISIFVSILSSRAESDHLLQSHQLKDGEYLVSAGKVFVLGFFTLIPRERNYPEGRNSPRGWNNQGEWSSRPYYISPEILRHNRYLGVWYKGKGDQNVNRGRFANQDSPMVDTSEKSLSIGDMKPVWVANRDNPISDTSGSLMIDGDGRLEILQGGKSLIGLSSKLASKQTKMVLLDTGNLVLSELGLNESRDRILWQSFDYPTDTLLPGMRLGYSLKTRHKWVITSWLSDEVPARGSFTLGADPDGTNQLIIWKRGEVYWKSGNWSNIGQFKNLHDPTYGYEYSSNTNESFFKLALSAIRDQPISFPAVMIDELGVLNKIQGSSFSMNPLVNCHTLEGGGGGCVGFKLPKCRSKVGSGSSYGYMVSECLNYAGNLTLSLADCEAMCLPDCSCVAYGSQFQNGTGCQLCSSIKESDVNDIYDDMKFYVLDYPYDRHLLLFWTIIGAIIFVSVLFLAYVCYSIWIKLKMGVLTRQLFHFLRKKVRAIGRRITEDRTSFVELGTTTSYSAIRRKRKLKILYYKSHGLQLFTFENLSRATDGFSPSNKLGQGGFGTVYKGKLEGGQEVAVKRLSRSSKQGVKEFKNELKVIAKLQHTNLVTIIGCCVERGEKIVVYEYMPNKSLDCFLFDSNRRLYLDWKKRFNIIEGIAQGLLYLHKYSSLKIIHRDLKAANILLDEELNAKISDFGMARIFGRDETQAKTKRIVGTPGYISPEYMIGGKYSAKSDVFSFGVLLIEIVSGKKNHASYHPDRPLNLIGQAWELWMENRSSELIEETLAGGLMDKEQAMRCIHVGLLCAQEKPSDRPSISDAVTMISNGSIRLDPPNRPGFLARDSVLMKIEELEQDSVNDASISETVGR